MTELLMLGAGGHARVLQESLALQGLSLAGYLDPGTDSRLDSVPHLGDDDALRSIDTGSSQLVNGVGSTRASGLRESVYATAVALGFRFVTVIDPTAIVRPSASIGAGVQVLAGAIVNTRAIIGENSIINTGAIIEHDCVLKAHVHVAPGAVLAGQVTVGARSHIGLGARVLNGVSVGSDCTIGAGAVVTRDVPDGSVAVGVPARALPER